MTDRIPDKLIFVNYRTEDEPFGAALIDHELSAVFGSELIFRAPKSIRVGDDFATAILHAVRRSSALLVLIGPRWLTAADSDGIRRLDKPGDWVRQEIAEALRHSVRVIPVLLNTTMPTPADLPPDIAELASCQYVRLHHRTSGPDVRRLIDELAKVKVIPRAAPVSRRRLWPKLAAAALALAFCSAGLAYLFVSRHDDHTNVPAPVASSPSSVRLATTQPISTRQPSTAAGTQLRQDRITLTAEDNVYLEEGMAGSQVPYSDLYFPTAPETDLQLAVAGDAVMAVVPSQTGFAGCQQALQTRRDGYVKPEPGTWLCVRTNHGNIAAVQILAVTAAPQSVLLAITVWRG